MSRLKTITSVESLLDVLEQSGICTDEQLGQLRAAIADQELQTPKQVIRFLIDCGALTLWQARRLLAGITQFHIGNYVLLEQIGSSGLGRVFLAHHGPLRRKVAIKAFHRELTQDPQAARSLLDECRQAAALDHRNLIHIFDVDEDRGRVFLVMEYVDGMTMRQYVEHNHPVPVLAALDFLHQLAGGLGHLHDHGLVHGHVRPENVLIESDGRIKLIGLGGRSMRELAAAPTDDQMAAERRNVPSKSESGEQPELSSEASFRAPEELHDAPPTTKSDVYSLGCTAYFLLTGKEPSPTRAGTNSLDAGDSPPVSQLRPELPRQVTRVVTRMMAKRPADRYRDATIVAELLADLRATLADSLPGEDPQAAGLAAGEVATSTEASGTPTTRSGRRLRWLALACGLFLLMAGIGTGVWWYFLPGGGEVAHRNTAGAAGQMGNGESGERTPREHEGATSAGEEQSNSIEQDQSQEAAGSELPDLPTLPGKGPAGNDAPKPESTDGSVEQVPLSGKPSGAGATTAPALDEPEAPEKPEPTDKKASPPSKAPKSSAKKKQSKKNAAAPVKPAPEPFAKLPARVALPLPESGTSPIVIGPVELGPRDLVFVRLLGGNQALKGSGAFEIGAAQGGLSSRAWTITYTDKEEKTPIATLDIADNQLRFHWEPAAVELRPAGSLINTLLTFTTKGKVHKLALREPLVVPALPVDLSRSSTTTRWKIPAMPDPVVVFCEVSKLSEGFPKAAYDPDKVIPLARKSLRIRLGEKPEESLFFLEVAIKPTRTSVTATVTPYFQESLDATPRKITSKDVQALLKHTQAAQQQLATRIAQIKQLQKVNSKASREQKAFFAQQLNLAEQKLQEVANVLTQLNKLNDLQQSLPDKAAIHLRFFARIGEDQIDLLDASGPIEE